MTATHHPATRAALNLPGLCPVCGGEASRKVTWAGGRARETYRCAMDGETEYLQGADVRIRIAGHPVVAEPRHFLDGFQPLGHLVEA